MKELFAEIGLRLLRAVAALILGVVVWAVATGLLGAHGSIELALLSWLSGAAFVVLMEASPI